MEMAIPTKRFPGLPAVDYSELRPEPVGVRTVPLRKYLEDYDSHGNPYPGRLAIARHRDFAGRASRTALRNLGRFAVDLFGYPYDKNEIARIAARIVASRLGFS